jgi:hypothetical protein
LPDRSGRAARLTLALAAVLLAGCAHSNQRQAQGEMAELQHGFPGEYSTGGSGAEAVTLTISSVSAQLVGDNVYYVRETPSNNHSLVLWQGVWTLVGEAERKRDERHGEHQAGAAGTEDALRIVQHNFLFKEPRRWGQAGSNPEVLESMLPQDLKALPGCDLVWHKDAMGFATEGTLEGCRPGSEASGLPMVVSATLHGADLSLTERQVDDSGSLDMRAAAQTLNLSRTGSAP